MVNGVNSETIICPGLVEEGQSINGLLRRYFGSVFSENPPVEANLVFWGSVHGRKYVINVIPVRQPEVQPGSYILNVTGPQRRGVLGVLDKVMEVLEIEEVIKPKGREKMALAALFSNYYLSREQEE